MSCSERLSAGPECTMTLPLPSLGVSLALHYQGLCVLERPLSPFLIAQALHSQRLGPVFWLPLTTTEPHMLTPLGFQRIPALKTKRCFLWIWPSLSPPPYQPRAPKESPAPCLSGSPARPGTPQIDRPLQIDGLSLSTRLCMVAEHAQPGDTGTWGVQQRLQLGLPGSHVPRKELRSV